MPVAVAVALAPVLPKTIGVRFRVRRGGTCLPHNYVPMYSYAVNAAGSVLTQTATNDPFVVFNFDTSYLFSLITPPGVSLPVGTGGTKTLFDVGPALYDPSQTPPYTNIAALQSLAQQLATDYIAWRTVGFDLVYNGVINPAPSGLNDVIEFTYLHHDQSTRVRSRSFGGEPQEYQHQDSAVSSSNYQKWDRTPGILKGIPGGSGNSSFIGLETLEAGRLFMKYDHSNTLGCGCSSPNCLTCEGNLPPMKLVDSANGGPFNELAVGDAQYNVGYPAASTRGFIGRINANGCASPCPNFPTTPTPATQINAGYVLACKFGFTDRFILTVYEDDCIQGSGRPVFPMDVPNPIRTPSHAVSSSNAVLISSIADCTNPGSLVFTIPSSAFVGFPNSPWFGGATITVSKQ